mgnify:CR=1 FL=1
MEFMEIKFIASWFTLLPIDTLIKFLAASLLLAIAPGPDNIFVLTQSALYGCFAGIAVVMGLCTGVFVHTSAVALGVAVIFQSSELAFSVLKLVGAGYLAYLAFLAFKAPVSEIPNGRSNGESDLWLLYRRGIIMNVTNPKVSIFFLAFLPQFADPARGSISIQIFLLGALFSLSTILVFGLIAFLSGKLGQTLKGSALTQKILNKIAGAVFLGLAIKLITANR